MGAVVEAEAVDDTGDVWRGRLEDLDEEVVGFDKLDAASYQLPQEILE